MELSKEVDVCFDSGESNEKRNCYETESERQLFFEKMNVNDELNASIPSIAESRCNMSVASVNKVDINVENCSKNIVERKTKSSDASVATTTSNEMTGIRLRNREKRKSEKVDIVVSIGESASVVKRCRRRKNNDSTKVNVSTNNSKRRKVGDKNETEKLLRSGKKTKLEFDDEKKTKEKVKSKSSKCQVFFCEKCDKVYDQYSELVYHERRHTGEKPFLCTWPGCKKAFSASNARVRHMRTHTGEKPYVCPLTECGRRFTYWKDLKLHKYRHTGEKPHKCDWEGCSARFFRKDDLKHHRYTHTGEKPYKCTWQGCVAAFSQKSPLNLHVRKTHKNENVSKSAAAVATNCVNPSSVLLPNYHTPNLPSVTATNILYTQQPVNSNILVTHSHSSFNSPVIGVSTANSHENLLLSCRMSNQNVSHNISSTIIAAMNPWNIQESFHENNLPQEQTALRHLPTNFDTQKSVSPENFQSNNSTMNALNQITSCESIELQQPNCVNSMSITNSIGRESDFKSCSINSNITKDLDDSSPSVVNKPKLREVSLGPDSVDFRYLNNQPVKITVPPVSIDASIGDGNVVTTSENVVTQTVPIPVRKRANYRLKVQPAEIIKNNTNVSKVTTVRKQTKKANEDSITKRSSKRTIAVQTVKRSIQKNEKGTLHECDICSRKFKAKHDRDCHRMTHTGEKPRACDWPGCDYRCITKSKLIRHKRKHTGERNYPCDWPGCEKKFATSRHMKEHRRSHTGEKPFKCDWPGCDKWFSRKDHIKNHRYTHTGEKPRKCPYPGCESAFIQLSPLKKHMELHKRDGGCVPNRTRRKKTVNNNETMKNSCVTNTASLPVSTDTVVNLPAISEHSSANFGVIGIQENPNCCIAGYEAVNPAIHMDYEVILRANYC